MRRYGGIKEIRNTNENAGPLLTQYYQTVLYPEIPDNPDDVWVITNFGDRLDLLRIPVNINGILSSYNNLNGI